MKPRCPHCNKPIPLHVGHVGQWVQGDVKADTIAFNVDFASRVAEMSAAELVANQSHYARAQTLLKGLLAGAVSAVLAVWLYMIGQIPAYLRAYPPPPEFGAGGMLLLLMMLSAVFVWTAWRMWFRDWAKRKKRALAELDRVIAIIDVEIARRVVANPMSFWQRVRLWLRTQRWR